MPTFLAILVLGFEARGTAQTVLLEIVETTTSFGSALAGPGDVDADGVPDVLVGAYAYDPGAMPYAGRVSLYSGASGSLLREWVGGQSMAQFGLNVARRGDVDGDGVPEVMFFGGVGPEPLLVMSGTTGAFLQAFRGLTGEAVGDLTGDGVEEVAAGDPGWAPPGGSLAGRVVVYEGRTAARLFWVAGINGSAFGRDVAAVGDVNFDGIPDIAASARNIVSSQPGYVWVLSGTNGSVLATLPGIFHSGFGYHIAGPGDMNGDGAGDVAVSAVGASGGPVGNAGLVRVFSGLGGYVLYDFWGALSNELLGISLAGPGDVDADGRPDLVVGAAGSSVPCTYPPSSRVKVFSGRTGEILFEIAAAPPTCSCIGGAASSVGDFNADGFDDFLVSGPCSPLPGVPYNVRVYSGAPSGVSPFGAFCASPGGWQPRIGAARPPAAGSPSNMIKVHLSNAPGGALAVLLLGFSNSSWLGIPLPVDLGMLGMPGCALLVSPDFALPAVAAGSGLAGAVSIPLAFSADPTVVGASVYFQWFVDEPSVPGLVGATSRGLHFVIQ